MAEFRRLYIRCNIELFAAELFSKESRRDVIFTDYGHEWEALRRVAHSAVM